VIEILSNFTALDVNEACRQNGQTLALAGFVPGQSKIAYKFSAWTKVEFVEISVGDGFSTAPLHQKIKADSPLGCLTFNTENHSCVLSGHLLRIPRALFSVPSNYCCSIEDLLRRLDQYIRGLRHSLHLLSSSPHASILPYLFHFLIHLLPQHSHSSPLHSSHHEHNCAVQRGSPPEIGHNRVNTHLIGEHLPSR
jgi:hypothetical protein